jgi:hypothetical protein
VRTPTTANPSTTPRRRRARTACFCYSSTAQTRGGRTPSRTALDDDRLKHVRLLLEGGADPNEGAIVSHAVRRGRGPQFLRLLGQHGADLDQPGGETWRGNVPLRGPYQHAVLRGRSDQAEALAELGAATDVDPDDAAVASVARGERPPDAGA